MPASRSVAEPEMVSYEQRVLQQCPKIILVPLGPFDRCVAAIHTRYPNYYITTPNQADIFAPPSPCNICVRLDGWYGLDDHMQWPQLFSWSVSYLCCVPKKDGLAVEYSIMWWNPTHLDFKAVQNHKGIGFLPHHELRLMGECCERLNERADNYQANIGPNIHHPIIKSLSINLCHTLSCSRVVAMTHIEVLFECWQVQRLWMELWALMDYTEICKPCMEGHVPPAKEMAKVIGCFITEANIAEKLFAAGIPYWLMCPISTFIKENILSITTMVEPWEVLELNNHLYPFPCIYIGDSNSNRLRVISEHGLRSLRYMDLFVMETLEGSNHMILSKLGCCKILGIHMQGTTNHASYSVQPIYARSYV